MSGQLHQTPIEDPIESIKRVLCRELPFLTGSQIAEFFPLLPQEKKQERIHRVRPILHKLVQDGLLQITQTGLPASPLIADRPLWRKGDAEDTAAIVERFLGRIPAQVPYKPTRLFFATLELVQSTASVQTFTEDSARHHEIEFMLSASNQARTCLNGKGTISRHEILAYLCGDKLIQLYNLAVLYFRQGITPLRCWVLRPLHEPLVQAHITTTTTSSQRVRRHPHHSFTVAILGEASPSVIEETIGHCDQLW